MFAEWPVTDSRVTESTLVDMAGGGVRLDVDKVWHPQLVIKGAFRHDRFHQRLELRNLYAGSNSFSKSTNPTNSLNRAQAGLAARGLPNESSIQSIRSHNRAKTLKVVPDGDGPNYSFMERFVFLDAIHRMSKGTRLFQVTFIKNIVISNYEYMISSTLNLRFL